MIAIIVVDIPSTNLNVLHRDTCPLVKKADESQRFPTETPEVVTTWGRVYFPVPCEKCKPTK